ncbi:ankyrin repeat domain-containing protein 53 isoform X1 [Myxocyprinus asiaticus]|uniref:ankyrin repeat domain-containing protein 53 isoform X1 n=2 Tax=Myxocyprinus asiaticus TaxID=70543 RepID=UPI00222378E3|nr:ankyrin repeat domain-containing protein 53 isoform X1 [Myxocyprinus asiaticus]XP_051555617.1 ankyrin repeat domain-containing protein 53 isoform X1 [Myxocyprinus asiaticus]
MFHAAMCGDREWLILSLKRAREPLQTDKQGLTVLHIAALHGHLDCMEVLLEARDYMDVNASCPHGRRPLHMVLADQSKPNSHTCLNYLLEHGAQPNVTTDKGLTPLHLAATEGLRDCTETLVRIGADTTARDIRGHTPLDLARIWGHRAIARFLRDAMWQKDKQQEMEKRKQLHNLRQDLVMMHTMAKIREKMASITVNKQRLSEWAKRKGCTLEWAPMNVKQRSRHLHCLSQTGKPKNLKKCHPGTPKEKWNISPIPSKPPPGSISQSQGVRMGTLPDELPPEPDLRNSVMLGCWRDGCPYYTASWDGTPQPVPDLPLDILLRGLFPLAFPSRLDSPHHFKSSSVLDLPRLGRSSRLKSSPWTEVAMHLAEELQPGHY